MTMASAPWPSSRRSLSRFGVVHFILGALAVYVLVTGVGLTIEGYNSDDWRHLAGHYEPWAENEGRWAMEFLFRDVLGGAFHTPVQIGLAFLCFLAIAWILAGAAAAPAHRPLAAFLTFVIGVNHLYMADALNFNAHVFAYPLALLLSLAAFRLLMLCLGRPWWLWLPAVLVAAQVIAVSYAIYQPFAIFGAVLPLLALLRWDRYPLAPVLLLFAMSLLASVLALGLQGVEWKAYMAWQGREIGFRRFGAPAAGDLAVRLVRMPELVLSLLRGGLMAPPRLVRLFLFGIALAALAWPVLASLWAARGLPAAGRLLAVLRAGAAALGLLIVLPGLFSMAGSLGELSPRAVGFLGFWLAALILAGQALFDSAEAPGPLRRRVGAATLAVLAGFAVVNVTVSSLVWSARADLSRAEMALAHGIHAAVLALGSYRGEPIRLVGSRKFGEFRWGGAMGVPVFHGNNPQMGILQQTFGTASLEEALTIGPQACPAFPAPGSVFLRDGHAYVCLAESDALLPLTDCVQPKNPVLGTVCRKDQFLVRVLDSCPDAAAKSRTVSVSLPGETGSHGLDNAYPFFALDGRCYQAAPILTPAMHSVDFGIIARGQGLVDRETITFH